GAARDLAKELNGQKKQKAVQEAQGFDAQKGERLTEAEKLKKLAEQLSQKADAATGRAQAFLEQALKAEGEEAQLREKALAREGEAAQKKKDAQTADAQAQDLHQECQQLAAKASKKDTEAENARKLGEVLRDEQTQAARDMLGSLLAEAIARVEQVRARVPDVLKAQPEHAIDQGQAKTALQNAVATAPLDQVKTFE